jgi:hypothetical protein
MKTNRKKEKDDQAAKRQTRRERITMDGKDEL